VIWVSGDLMKKYLCVPNPTQDGTPDKGQ